MDTDTLNHLAQTLGLTPDDITDLLTTQTNEQPTLSLGPPFYHGGRYGTYSIHDYPPQPPRR